ncbi:fatty acid desaturase [Archangium violaceum]|uniref:fatty acid desaturase family protein n=1 Tax=Archangium violaceum TaxID=83451 RepID=UPI0019527747|nr:fatty acid desaturase [Archangium violaceum]QRN96285.1 fatty acid desaturase [Archangium violaceum]
MPIVAMAQYVNPTLIPYLSPLGCYLALSAGVIAHNHNHCPTFKNRRLNFLMSLWLAHFYGYPTFAWVPTHNLNHHKYVNKAGDATITWRYTTKHNWWVAFTYFFVSSYWQSDPIKQYIGKARQSNPTLFRQIVTQYMTWAGLHLALLGLAIAWHGPLQGLKVWGFAFLIPALFALWTIMFFNYIQHVHADPWSEHDHSRNFDGKLINFLLFNNGLHAAHHEMPGAHWSMLREAHEKIAPQINPQLIHGSFFWFCFSNYVLAPVFPKLGTKQVGRAPYDVPTGEKLELSSADVDALESGINAART